MIKIKHFITAFTTLAMFCIGSVTASAYTYDDLSEGIYQVKTELSCYVNAMGGVEFGSPLLTSASVEVSQDGSKTMTLYFTKSQVTIYGITCDTFIDVSPSYITETNGIKSGTLGYYNADGTLVTNSVTYTLSDDTAENAQKEQVHYVNSISFPIEYQSDTYNLTLFVNSNVMGTQFTKDGYTAALNVDWSSASAEGFVDTDDTTNPETPPTTQISSNTSNVENKDGLNIYHTNEETKSNTELSETTDTGYYVAHFREPILVAVSIIAGVMIFTGVVLIIFSRREKKV